MQRFFYNQKIKIGGIINQLNQVMSMYNARHYNTDKALLQLLKDGIPLYKDLGYSEKECHLQSLQAEYITAQRGINPCTLVKQTLKRNDLLLTVMFKILQALELQFKTDYIIAENKLQEAAGLISQIIVAAIQGGFLTGNDIGDIKTQNDLEDAWKKIGADANISLGQKRVLLSISSYDALLLFDELLTPLKTN